MIQIDAQNLRVLMEINSLQSFGSVQSYSEQAGSSSSMFNSMLEEILGQSTSSPSSLLEATLGSHNLQYSGTNQVFLPSTLTAALAASKQSSPSLSESPAPSSKNYKDMIKQAAEKFDLPERLISSIIQHESNFNSNAVSHAGAEGLMQLMPGTAKFLGVKNSFDPEQNITGGARYLRQMLNQFDGSIEHALAAYNAGPGNVRKHGGIPPFKETQNYVQNVLNTYNA